MVAKAEAGTLPTGWRYREAAQDDRTELGYGLVDQT